MRSEVTAPFLDDWGFEDVWDDMSDAERESEAAQDARVEAEDDA